MKSNNTFHTIIDDSKKRELINTYKLKYGIISKVINDFKKCEFLDKNKRMATEEEVWDSLWCCWIGFNIGFWLF
jgi:hypothetical protein